MAAKIVKVTFDSTATPRFKFDPLNRDVDIPDDSVQWKMTKAKPTSPDFTFEAVTFYSGPHPFRNTKVDDQNNVMDTDVHAITKPHHYSVVVSVTDGAGKTTYYSSKKEWPPDTGPTIRNH